MAARSSETVTVIVVPDSNRHTLNFRLPVRLLVVGLTLLLTATVILTVAAAVLIRDYYEATVAARERDLLRREASRKEYQIHAMNTRVLEIEAQLTRLAELDQRVRNLLGEDEPVPGAQSSPSGSGGAGGPGTLATGSAGLYPAQVQGAADVFPPEVRSYLLQRRVTSVQASRSLTADRAGRGLARAGEPGTAPDQLDHLDALLAEATMRTASLVQAGDALENYLDYQAHRPTGYPVLGRQTDDFGWRRSPFNRKKREFHEGLDLAVPAGTPVKATGAGKVTYAGWKGGGYGNIVVIDHGYGFKTLYAHNRKVKVEVGDQVQRGDVIALAGSTGRSTGPHVHYEVHVWGRPVDPEDYAD